MRVYPNEYQVYDSTFSECVKKCSYFHYSDMSCMLFQLQTFREKCTSLCVSRHRQNVEKIVIFTHAIFQEGGSCDASTGIYTALGNCVYFFTSHITKEFLVKLSLMVFQRGRSCHYAQYRNIILRQGFI